MQHHRQNPSRYEQASRSVFMSSIVGLSNIIAALVTFFTVPVAYSNSIVFVQRFTSRHYGYGFEDITAVCWWIIVALLIFFGARASISTALVMGGLALAARFL